jgi:hypothetical protein
MKTLKLNATVKISHFLTTDPLNRQGQTCRIIEINKKEDFYKVEFENGVLGSYSMDKGVFE